MLIKTTNKMAEIIVNKVIIKNQKKTKKIKMKKNYKAHYQMLLLQKSQM